MGYRRLEEASNVDVLYMTVVSISTVGYGEIPHPFSPATRLFTIGMIVADVSIADYGPPSPRLEMALGLTQKMDR
jgi:hypothetical protein